MAESYEALDSLRTLLKAEREKHKEALAEGHSKPDELVGRCKGLKWAIGKVSEQIKDLTGDKDDGDGKA